MNKFRFILKSSILFNSRINRYSSYLSGISNIKLSRHQFKYSLCFNFSQTFKIKVFNRNIMDLKSVIKVIETALPPELAEKWDKTGLLIEPDNNIKVSSIFFTIDLTEKVLEEAISLSTNLIIAYHPPIFSPMSKLVTSNWKDRIVMKCVKNCIAVYSPHTICDIVPGGVNDWLLFCFDVIDVKAVSHKQDFSDKCCSFEFSLPTSVDIDKFMKTIVGFELLFVNKYKENQLVRLSSTIPETQAIEILSSQGVEFITINPCSRTMPSKGIGRVAKLRNPKKLKECIYLIKSYLDLDHIRFAQGNNHSLDSEVNTIAVCAGSGATVLRDVKADLYITGEMSHHEILDATHKNVSIILAEHSNSERGYLQNLVDLLQPKLRKIKMNISTVDKDPINII